MREKLKRNKNGITLMVLVVTIIVLLILAAVTINLTLNDGGILSKARKAANEWDKATEQEEASLSKLANEIEKARTGEIGEPGAGDEELGNIDISKIVSIVKEEVLMEVKNEMYPVGSIYISAEMSTKEAVESKLGGTWEKYGEGRTLIGEGTGNDQNGLSKEFAINSQGGEYNHHLTINEMPSHNHPFSSGGNSRALCIETADNNRGFYGWRNMDREWDWIMAKL